MMVYLRLSLKVLKLMVSLKLKMHLNNYNLLNLSGMDLVSSKPGMMQRLFNHLRDYHQTDLLKHQCGLGNSNFQMNHVRLLLLLQPLQVIENQYLRDAQISINLQQPCRVSPLGATLSLNCDWPVAIFSSCFVFGWPPPSFKSWVRNSFCLRVVCWCHGHGHWQAISMSSLPDSQIGFNLEHAAEALTTRMKAVG